MAHRRTYLRHAPHVALLCGALLELAASVSWSEGRRRDPFAPACWRRASARPESVPARPGNPITREKVELGRSLFHDPRLSGTGAMACVTCHDPALSFSDGVARRPGHDG